MLRPLIAVAFLTLSACAARDVSEDQKRPDSVTPGMSSRQVATLMGRSWETCWRYGDANVRTEIVCFRNGIATAYVAGGANTRIQPPSSAQVVGLTAVQVGALMGAPRAINESYSIAGKNYVAEFAADKLITFHPTPYGPIPSPPPD